MTGSFGGGDLPPAVEATFDWAEESSAVEATFAELCARNGYRHVVSDAWPAAMPDVPADAIASRRDVDSAAFLVGRLGGSLVRFDYYGGTIRAQALGRTLADARAALEDAREIVPRGEVAEDAMRVHFWSYGQHGPSAVIRDLDSMPWEAIEENYTPEAAEGLGELMDPGWRPGSGGKLLLWAGPPGTGKTTALRALAHQWRGWCSLHYIADPDKFFGDHADYMLTVMLTDEPQEIAGREVGEPVERWRLLVLEDTGELLAQDARAQTGQALSRFLNVVDGLIGRGLRVVVLVTTNEEVGRLHSAVTRPGRCAARVDFDALPAEQAAEWLDVTTQELDGSKTIAELYAIREGRVQDDQRPAVGFGA